MTYFIFQPYWFGSENLFIIFSVLFFLWIIGEIFNNIQSVKNPKGNRNDRGSYWIIVLGIFISLAFSFIFKGMPFGNFISWVQVIGVFMMVGGIILREWSVITLGKGFTVIVNSQKNGTLIKKGPYHILRHPSYTGTLIIMMGIPLALGTWISFIFSSVITLATHIYRIHVEEKALIEAYGKDYKNYSDKTWKLIPGIY